MARVTQVTNPPLTEKQKRYLRTLNGTKTRFAVDAVVSTEVKRLRDFSAPYTIKLNKRFKRGTSGCRMSPEKRAMVQLRLDKRAAFFAELGVQV
jgi:hypothetical protein